MSHIEYELASIRRDELLREAADRRLAATRRPRRLRRLRRLRWLRWPVRTPHVSLRPIAKGH